MQYHTSWHLFTGRPHLCYSSAVLASYVGTGPSGWCSSKLSRHVYICDQVILMLAQTSTAILYDIMMLLFMTCILGIGFRGVHPSISSSGSGPSGCLLAFTPWRRNTSCCGAGKLAHLFEIFLLVLMHQSLRAR